MREDYCFRCGSFTKIDEHTKLCDRCYSGWCDRGHPQPPSEAG